MNQFNDVEVSGSCVVPAGSGPTHAIRKSQLDETDADLADLVTAVGGKQAAHAILTALAALGAGAGYLKKQAGDAFDRATSIPRADITIAFTGLAGVAFVESTGVNGTAAIGDPTKPYLTVQAAFDAGARIFSLGVGTFDAVACGTSGVGISLMGRGIAKTTLSGVTGRNLTVQDIGFKSLTITGISSSAVVSPSIGITLTAYGCAIGTINGGAVDVEEPASDGQSGANGGVVTLFDCAVTSVSLDGGAGHASTVQAGDGGDAGTITATRCNITGGTALRGAAGVGEEDGLDGAEGSDGTVSYNFTVNGATGMDYGGGTFNQYPLDATTLWLGGSATLDFPSVTAGGVQDLTVSVPGLLNQAHEIILGTPAPTAGIVYSAWVSAVDTVTVRATNITAGALNPASGTFKVLVNAPY